MSAAERQHAEAGPSSSKTWIQCPASVTLSRGVRRKGSFYANEGTAAHAVAEFLIRDEPVPPTIKVDDDVIPVTDEMLDHVSGYVNFAQMLQSFADFFAVEQRVTLEPYYPEGMPEPVFGTADMIAYNASTRRLTVADFKYGKGVRVDARDNSQARIYALGAMALLNQLTDYPDPVEIETLIFQPRLSADPSIEIISNAELMTWFVQKLKPAIERIGAGDTTENPGECTFCPRLGSCRAVHRTAQETARLTFGKVSPPETRDLTNEELGDILTKAEMIEAWVGAVRAEASARIDRGQKVPGWKLVAKRASRKWVDEDAAFEALRKHGLPVDRIDAEPKIKSPAQIEKELKAFGDTKEGIDMILKPLVVKESSGTTLVEDSDERPGVDLKTVFGALPTPSAADVF